MRIPVVDQDHKPLMPTTTARARKWIESGKAVKRWSDAGQFYVQLTCEPSSRNTQDIVIGIDPVKRPPYSRRQLHLMVSAKGGNRRKYGGSTTRHGLRKGDLVDSPKGIGYVSGETKTQVSVSDSNWKRLGQIDRKKVSLIRRSNGLILSHGS
jgi:hypothetical protein